MTYLEADEYITLGIEEGYYLPDQFFRMSRVEIIKFAEKEAERGDAEL